MKDRFSICDRWKDRWFMSLSPNAKVIFSYLCDTCSDSGFAEVNYSLWEVQTGLKKNQIKESLMELQKNLLSDKKAKLWVKSHLFWQRYLPLHRGIQEHDLIIRDLENNLKKFGDSPDIQKVLNEVVDLPIDQKNVGSKKKFLKRIYL